LNRPLQSVLPTTEIHPDALTPVFQAEIEAVTEAQINAIMASHNVTQSKR
jgi:hypothetical protein